MQVLEGAFSSEDKTLFVNRLQSFCCGCAETSGSKRCRGAPSGASRPLEADGDKLGSRLGLTSPTAVSKFGNSWRFGCNGRGRRHS